MLGSRLANDMSKGQINYVKVRVPGVYKSGSLTLLDSPVMLYCRFMNIYVIRNATELFNTV